MRLAMPTKDVRARGRTSANETKTETRSGVPTGPTSSGDVPPRVRDPRCCRPTDAESRTLRPSLMTRNSGPNFWDWTDTGAVVDSALRSRRPSSKDVRRATSSFDVCPGECCGQGIRELGLPKVLSETARRGDDRQTFRSRDGARSTRNYRMSACERAGTVWAWDRECSFQRLRCGDPRVAGGMSAMWSHAMPGPRRDLRL